MSFPSTVGRYRIDRALGSGAFASVWLGHDDALDSMVAIKVLNGSLLDDLDVRNRFLEEARILRRADSERLVRVHDIGELPDGRPYFVMSYADKGTLADRMKQRPLPVAEALRLAEETAYGVEVINTLGVIHRDLKPSNVLFQSTPDGGGEKVLIADLGLAKALAHASGAFTLPVGTPGYMSPEQARFGGGLDVRADVYGLGALVFHMLTGRAPGPAPIQTSPSELREGLPAGTDEVVLRALEVEREKRWPTSEAFGEALADLRAKALAETPGESASGTPAGSASGTPAGKASGTPMEAPATVAEHIVDGPADPPSTLMDVPTPQRRGDSGEPGTPHGASYPGVQDEAPEATVRDHSQQPYGDRPPGAGTLPPGGGGDDARTTEMALPPGPPGGARSSAAGPGYPVAPRDSGEATILDQPGGRYGEQAPPPAGNDGKTAVFQAGGPSYGPGPGQGQGQGPGQGPGPGQSPGPGGHPYGPGPSQSPPPHGYPPPAYQGQQPPPPGMPDASGKGASFGRKKKGPAGPGGPSGPGGGGNGGGDRRRYLTPLLITAAVLTVALVAGLALGSIFSKDDKKGGGGKDGKKTSAPADFVQVTDDSGKISAFVPKTWPKAGPDRTWLPSGVGFVGDATARPVLRATPDVAKFRNGGTGAGVFVGLTTAMPKTQTLPTGVSTHASCTKGAPENYTSPDNRLTGTILRFTACRTGTPQVTEIALHSADQKYGAWVRIRQTDNADIVKAILDNLKLQAP